MKKAKTIMVIVGVFMLLISYGNKSVNSDNQGVPKSEQTVSTTQQTTTKPKQTTSKTLQTTKPKQTTTKPKQTTSKPKQTGSKTAITKSVPSGAKSEPAKPRNEAGTVKIGTLVWSVTNLNVGTFKNGDTIPEAKTNKEWVTAGEAKKPAWCYYNNDPAYGKKFGRLYNWYAVNDPRGLAPEGWTLASDADWTMLANSLGGSGLAGNKTKSTSEWKDGNYGTNESGFTGLPGGYRVENGSFLNAGSIGSWWSSTESKTSNAYDRYLSMGGSLDRSSSPKERGSSVRCLRK